MLISVKSVPVTKLLSRRMRSVTILSLALVSTALTLAQPKLAIEKSNVDLGTIYNGMVKKAHIVIKNSGKDSLKILGVQTSCGCTTVKQPKSVLKPGESDAVEIEFNSTGWKGKVTKHIMIQSNDPTNPTATVTLVSDVVEELEPVGGASVLWLGSLPIGKEVIHKVAFKNVAGKPMTLKNYSSSSPRLSVRFDKKSVMPSDTIQITLKIYPEKTDYFNEQIFLETDSDKQTKVPLRVTFVGVKPS